VSRGSRPGGGVLVALIGAACIAVACGTATPSEPAVGTPAASGGIAAGSPAPGTSAAAPGGSSAPAIPDVSGRPDGITAPAAGVDSLPGYRATLTLSFAGTQRGTPVSWSQAYTLTADRSSGLRVLEYSQDGLGDGPAPRPALEAADASTWYTVMEAGDACVASTIGTTGPPRLVEPASLLPGIVAMTAAAGTTSVGGIDAAAWTFSADSVRSKGNPSITGGATVARSGGLVLAYDLSIAGGHDVFDADTEGTYRWVYRLEPREAAAQTSLPADCPRSLPELPLLADARGIDRGPGSLAYETATGIEAAETYYEQAMPKAGFAPDGDPWLNGVGVSSRWTKDGRTFLVGIVDASPVSVRILEAAPTGAVVATPAPKPASSAEAATRRVALALTNLLGSDTQPTALGSYRLVFRGDAPGWDGKVIRVVTDATGDVAGPDVHFVVREKRGSAKAGKVEGYHVGGVDRAVSGRKLVDDYGMAYLAWVSWPLDAVSAVGIGAMRSEPAGTATIAGRPAEVYRVRGTAADDPTGMLAAFGVPVRTTDGTVWVDQATGALLKADIDYVADVKDGSKTHGTAKGSLTIVVTGVGETRVSMP
jgi:hypothetical protein